MIRFFISRWSPRAFTGEGIDERTLFKFFEAARWAPSANNAQPWRFIYAKNGSASWSRILNLLNENNQRWAAKSSALVVLISKTLQVRKGETQATPLRTHSFDAGAAWASLTFQALKSGWHTHAIGGFDRDKARHLLEIPDAYHIEVVIAIGKQADRSTLPPDLREREQPNQRNPIKDLVAEGRFVFSD